MALDPSIILGIKPAQILSGDERQANALKLKSLLLGNQEAQYKLDDYAQTRQREQQLRDLYTKNPKASGEDLRGAGFVKEGYEADKFANEQAKQKADIEGSQLKTNLEKFKHYTQGLYAVGQSDDPVGSANKFIQESVMFGTMSPEHAQALMQGMEGKSPEQIKQAAMQMFQQGLDAKDQLALNDYSNMDTGGTNQRISTNKLTGQVTPVYTVNKTQTPDSIASNQRMMQEGALNRGVTMRGQDITARGQDLTNQRALEKNGIDASNGGYSRKPMPATALKMQGESLDALATTKGINADLGAVLNQMETGKLNLGLMNKGIAAVKNNLNMSDENSRNIASFNSTLEKLRNDSLRLNKGVQTEGDSVRAWNEILNNTNDQEYVKERLKEVMAINQRATDLHKNNVDTIRNNYNVEPMDYSKYENQPNAVGAKNTPAAKATPKAISPQDKKAINWAKSNPNDPRAKSILKMHGM